MKLHKLILGALLATATLGHSQVLLNDQFTDGERDTQALPGSAKWVTLLNSGSTTSYSLSAATNRLTLTKTNTTSQSAVFGWLDAVQTLNNGDSIKLEFVLRFPVANGSNPALRFGLFNSGGGAEKRLTNDVFTATPNLSVDGTSTHFGSYRGYFANTKADSSATASFSVTERGFLPQREVIFGNLALNTATAGASLAVNTDYPCSLTITRSNTFMAITANVNGTLSYATDTGTWVTGFDTVYFVTAASFVNVTLDDIKVTYTPGGPGSDNPNMVILNDTLFPFTLAEPYDTGSKTNTLFIQNSGASATLNITNLIFSGVNSNNFSLLTALPLAVPAGQTGQLAIVFSPLGSNGILTADITLGSDDASSASVPLGIRTEYQTSGRQLLQFGDMFNNASQSTNGYKLDYNGLHFFTTPGLNPDSANCIALGQSATEVDLVAHTVPSTASSGVSAGDFFYEFYFQLKPTDVNGNDTRLEVQIKDNATPNLVNNMVRLRYNTNGVWQAVNIFNNFVSTGFEALTGILATGGSTLGVLDVTNAYRMRITGHKWGTVDANYDVALSAVNSSNYIKEATGIKLFFQVNTRFPAMILINNATNNLYANSLGAGYFVDDFTLTTGVPEPVNFKILTTSYNPAGPSATISWEAFANTNKVYTVEATTSLPGGWSTIATITNTAAATTLSYTDITPAASARFYRVAK